MFSPQPMEDRSALEEPPVPVLCLLPAGGPERAVIGRALESIGEGAPAAAGRGPRFVLVGSADGPDVPSAGAIVIGDLAQLSSMAGGAVPPAAFILVLDPLRGEAQGMTRLLLEDPAVVWCLQRPLDVVSVRAALRQARRWARLAASGRGLTQALSRRQAAHDELVRLGARLAAERDYDRLLALVLSSARALTGAEAGDLHMVETGSDGVRMLVLRKAQNAAVELPSAFVRLPLDGRTVAGHVAVTGEMLTIEDLYDLPPWVGYSFNRSLDRETGYRSRSAVVAPLALDSGEVIGVLQLVNRRDPGGWFGRFDEESTASLAGFAGQAAVCLENLRRHDELRTLLQGFVEMTVSAIESREPSRAGHAARVAGLSVALAEAVSRQESGPLAEVSFTKEALESIEMAARLHDLGAVALSDSALARGRRLQPHETQAIRDRFRILGLALDLEAARGGGEDAQRRKEAMAEAERIIEAADDLQATKPLRETAIRAIARRRGPDGRGGTLPWLTPAEMEALLSARKGSPARDSEEMRAHAAQTYQFLAGVPWPSHLKEVPWIAFAVHERLDGSGYPRGLTAPDIPMAARILGVGDLYDSLTASCRPPDRPMSPERAIAFLHAEARAGRIDANLVSLFIEARIWRRAAMRTEGVHLRASRH